MPTFDAEHRFTGYIGSCMDVTEKVEWAKKLIDLAHYDTLTSVFNRNYLEILIDFESQNRKKELYPLSVILIDVDNLGKYLTINTATTLATRLSSVAALMSGKLRESDYIGRFGGDEFRFCCRAPGRRGGFRYCTADSGRVAYAQHRKFL